MHVWSILQVTLIGGTNELMMMALLITLKVVHGWMALKGLWSLKN
jgi:hypothetical protein